ncbi:MAG TPA: hypothetical protein VKT19_02560 [Steroidobacteraceae bacterium]|nr:hypothetical protein [Steroidobacteraceae bacterium]
MTSLEASKNPGTPRAAAAASIDAAKLSDVRSASLSPRFEGKANREPSAELGYGCVDWFIYGADSRVASYR